MISEIKDNSLLMIENRLDIDQEIKQKEKQFIFFFLVLAFILLGCYALFAYFYDLIEVFTIHTIACIALLLGNIVCNKLEFSAQSISSLCLLLVAWTLFCDIIVLDNQLPIISIWYIILPIAAYVIRSLKSSIIWAIVSLFFLMLANYLIEDLSLFSNDISHLINESLIFGYSIIVSFLFTFISLFNFLTEFQKLRIRQATPVSAWSTNEESPQETKVTKDDLNNIPTTISDEESEKLGKLFLDIEKYFIGKKPYQDPNFSGYKLAAGLNKNLFTINKAINYKTGSNLKTLTNKYRVKDVKEKLLASEYKNYTFKHIYSNVGFSSQTTFNRAFKDVEGITPSEYIEQLEKW